MATERLQIGDAAVNFDTYLNLQRHRAVLPAIARLSCLNFNITIFMCVQQSHRNEDNLLRHSLTFGFSVTAIVWLIRDISGGHINPAVTIPFVVTRKISLLRYGSLVSLRFFPVLISRPLETDFLRSWSWSWSRYCRSWSWRLSRSVGLELVFKTTHVFAEPFQLVACFCQLKTRVTKFLTSLSLDLLFISS